jgi:hypothetical protein
MIGLTLGYAVLVCRDHEARPRVLSHEFRHVHQYEVAGSIAAFLPGYLQQIVAHGYANAPLEIDARFNRTRRYAASFPHAPVAAGRLTWSR